VSYNGSRARHRILVFSWYPVLKSKFLRKMDVKISLAVSLALNQILTGEPDTSFPDELRSTLRWTSPAGRQPERNYRLPNATRDKTRRLNIATYIKDALTVAP
jgi:hypothetical protein